MQNTRPPPPGLRAPLVTIPIHGIDVGQVQQRGHGGLFRALAGEEVGRRLCQDDADRQRAGVAGEGVDDDGDWGQRLGIIGG